MNDSKQRLATDATPDDHQTADEKDGFSLSTEEKHDVEEKQPPRAAVLHETIRLQGEEELGRSIPALGWSALAAGLSMGFSMLARGLLHRYLGEVPGAFLIESLGYPFGFLVVILARQQLFTENTMTAVLPLMTHPDLAKLGLLLRLWSVVFLGNLIGAALFAYGILHMQLFDHATHDALVGIGTEVMANSPWQMFTKGILAGWLIATMVWLVPAAEQAKITVIVLTTYLIALGGFTHIIVGSVEVLYLVFSGGAGFVDYVVHFGLPTLLGNIVGGSCIFALISHAQVRGDEA
ncbi:putative transporter, formate/nitrite transporter family protein [Rhodanobacter fulvus Jip2]|uniref:Putative transporter, formate/nitrite transporter family protein n=1 Tax=Rhodanobacter fulvus Jip2 TaxID=1163408 RepID=I4W077_9GAMM|nr:formate/nitrite transporter family protein [Rhodanobacter fulvus]EIL92868.1 putative transporter, formate/nitrite transporter family protein [Rhodanobacter fulvus Jip2]